MEKNLTTGSVFKAILTFALPYLLSYFLQTLYGMADLYITGHTERLDNCFSYTVSTSCHENSAHFVDWSCFFLAVAALCSGRFLRLIFLIFSFQIVICHDV